MSFNLCEGEMIKRRYRSWLSTKTRQMTTENLRLRKNMAVDLHFKAPYLLDVGFGVRKDGESWKSEIIMIVKVTSIVHGRCG